jgi:hypothetical protein
MERTKYMAHKRNASSSAAAILRATTWLFARTGYTDEQLQGPQGLCVLKRNYIKDNHMTRQEREPEINIDCWTEIGSLKWIFSWITEEGGVS